MILPYNTDAPIYHWPVVTVGLIVTNTLVLAHFLVQSVNGVPYFDAVYPWILQYGTGLQPVQWVTANFIHAGIWHLLGNMFALWGFGLVVEGKLGWWRFLLVYLGMGVVQCAFEQAVVPGSVCIGSLGASGVIFGLLAMALVWAPENEMSCFMLLGVYPITFDVNLATYAAFMGGIQITFMMLSGMSYGSEALHLIGGALGFGVGVAMLKLGWVDCEGWDLFSVWGGRHGIRAPKQDDEEPRGAAPVDLEELKARREAALAQISAILADGRHELAYAAHQRMARTLDGWRLPEPHFRAIIAGYHRQKKFRESVPLLVEYLRSYKEHAALVRLKLADILIRIERRPVQARRVLEKIPAGALDAAQEDYRRRLEQAARRLEAQDVLETAAEDW